MLKSLPGGGKGLVLDVTSPFMSESGLKMIGEIPPVSHLKFFVCFRMKSILTRITNVHPTGKIEDRNIANL